MCLSADIYNSSLNTMMDQKSTETLNMDLPPYSLTPKVTEAKKKWVLVAVTVVLLVVIIIGATLIGVYMSQKHTEEIVRMVFNSKDGEKVQQTISYNEQENLAAVFVNANNYSATVLYDYKRDLIGFRQSNGKKCFVMKMNKFITPPMSSVISGIKYFQTHKVPVDTDVSYNIIEGEEANPKDLGISINILCSDVPIYWGKQSNTEHRFKISFKFKVLGIPVKVTIGK